MLRQLTERTSLSDRPPVAVAGEAPLAILAQDTLEAGYQQPAPVSSTSRPADGWPGYALSAAAGRCHSLPMRTPPRRCLLGTSE
jgi:hypothetical protein